MVCDPSALVALLLGAPLEMPAALTVARIGGAAVLSLGVACWIARAMHRSLRRERPGRRDVVVQHRHRRCASTFAGVGLRISGVALWPAVALHALMAGWCVAFLFRHPLTAAVDSNLQHRSNAETGQH